MQNLIYMVVLVLIAAAAVVVIGGAVTAINLQSGQWASSED